jgi:uncharacterized protein (TIGR02145 family)
MKNRIILSVMLLFSGLMASAQRGNIVLTFTAENNGAYVQMDSIKVMNRTQGGDTMLYWPDTVLSVYYVGIHENPSEKSTFQVFQSYPNPVEDQTTVSLYVPTKDRVVVTVTDILGRIIVQTDKVLDKGKHSFRFTPGGGDLFFFTARWQGQSSSIKILQSGFCSGATSFLEYTGSENYFPELKTIKDIQDFTFSPGDELLYIGYADTLQSGILDNPEESTVYNFQYATNIPCPGIPTVEYEGQIYNTIQIFSQCWLKENLNVGTMIVGTDQQSNNGIIEKYCYNNNVNNCIIYGGLYQWYEMMQYTTQQGTQGICPPGWHLPTDEEWMVLEGAVDSRYGIGNNQWNAWGWNGYDVGMNLKTTSGWIYGGNGTDQFGFSAMPGGGCLDTGGLSSVFYDVTVNGYWWTTSPYYYINAWYHVLSYNHSEVARISYEMVHGFSVRCLRD